MTTPCKEWEGSLDEKGYGRLYYQGKTAKAHRVAYCEYNNVSLEDIAGKVVRHTCDNRPCINGEHLILGTQADNVQDRNLRSTNGRAIVDKETVTKIKAEYIPGSKEAGQPALGRKYGLSQGQVSRIVNSKCWEYGEAS